MLGVVEVGCFVCFSSFIQHHSSRAERESERSLRGGGMEGSSKIDGGVNVRVLSTPPSEREGRGGGDREEREQRKRVRRQGRRFGPLSGRLGPFLFLSLSRLSTHFDQDINNDCNHK